MVFMNVFSGAKLGSKRGVSTILDMFEDKIDMLSKVYSSVPDVKSELILEVLEQIKGDKANTFRIEKLSSDSMEVGAERWSEYVKDKFVLWTNLQLNRWVKRLNGKSQVSVHIPMYVASMKPHYNKLFDYLGSHERVENFIDSDIDEKSIPKDMCRSRDIIANSLKYKERKNLLERVRLTVSEETLEANAAPSASVKPEQEFRMLTKEFILNRPCNIKISSKMLSAVKYKIAGKIDQATEDEFVYRCGQGLIAPYSGSCREKCGKYDECWEEWKELK